MNRVLVVDDDEQNRYYLSALLSGSGYIVEIANQGEIALQLAREHSPDCIVSDLFMPVMDGYTLLRKWKEDEELKQIPFIVYTATYIEEQDQALAADLGADAFIVKGTEPDEFLRELSGVLEHAKSNVIAAPKRPILAKEDRLERYSSALVRKLEARTAQLEEANRKLESEAAERLTLVEMQAAILNALTPQVALIDSRGIIQAVNESWREFADANNFTGTNHAIGENYLDVCRATGGDDHAESVEAGIGIQKVLSGQLKYFALEYPCDTLHEHHWFRMIATPLSGSYPGGGAVIMHVDITERKNFELELQRAQEQYLLLLNSTAQGIYGLDLDGRCNFCNWAGAKLLGYTHPDDVRGIHFHNQHHHSHPDGTPYPEAECPVQRVIRTGETAYITDELFFTKTGTGFPVEYWAYPITDKSKIVGIVVTFFDITEQSELRAQLLQAQKAEAIGQLTGGIAHDFNNYLTVILGCSELLIEDAGEDQRQAVMAKMIQTAAQKGAELTHQLLAFGRRQALQPKAIDINRLLDEMKVLLKRTLREDIEFSLVHQPGLWLAMADPVQVESAILNLCINARDAMPSGGRLAIETHNEWVEEGYAEPNSDLKPGPYVAIVVTDSGLGIPPEHMEKIFDPFFSTKESGKGSGLGLSMVFGFAKQSRGSVRVYSEVNIGTSVKLLLPRDDSMSKEDAPTEPSPSDVRGTERILLVEDDSLVLAFALDQLVNLGYQVTSASNGVEALQILKENPHFDLLFTDVVMPGGLNGPDLVRQAAEVQPELMVLYTSGYTESVILHQIRADTSIHLLNKPYTRSQLARKIRSVLEERKGKA